MRYGRTMKGMLEPHTHGYLAGERAIGQADLTRAGYSTDYEKYREIIKEFIEENPDREIYLAAGWIEDEQKVTKAYLDEICPNKKVAGAKIVATIVDGEVAYEA